MQFSKFINPMLVKLDHWFAEGIIIVPNLVMAVVLMFVFRYLSGYGSRVITRILNRVSTNEALIGLLSAVTKIAILTIGVFFALGILGLEKTVASLVAGAGVLALALGFAFQDLTTNFISGAFIAIQRPIKVGDVIETNGYTGKVKSINLRSVILDNFAGQQVELPSKDIFQKPIVNFTYSGERRVQVDCGVAYNTDLIVAEQLAMATVRAMDFLSKMHEVEFNYTRFADNGIDFQLFFWIDQDKVGPGTAKSQVIKALKKTFEENNIVIPVGKKEPPKDADPNGAVPGK